MIEVLSLSPAKNASAVGVNTDIEINVRADFELDPRNISFKINDIDVSPNVFSVYQGGLDYDLDITLYSRARIKYGDEKRYGQEGLTYGQRDVFPSILRYGSRYVVEFTVWGINNLDEEETLTDSFVFTTEEGIFYNTNPKDYFYSDATQGVANYYPEWSKTRYDKFSNMQQLLNPLGEELEKIQSFVKVQGLNNHIQTADLNQLEKLHKVELGRDYEITSNLNEDGSTFFVQPEIEAVQEITRYDLFTEENNNLKEFFYEKLPTRIDTERLLMDGNTFHGPLPALEVREPVNKVLEREGTIVVSITGAHTSINRDERENVLILKCRIYGQSLFETDQDEDLILYNGRHSISKKLWKRIDEIQFFNLRGQPVEYELSHFRKQGAIDKDVVKEITTFEDNREILFWKHAVRNNNSMLEKRVTVGDTGGDVLRNSGRTETIQEYHLLDIDGVTPVQLLDIAVDSFSDKFYGVDTDYLYIFDKREPYPERLKEIKGDNGVSDLLIELDSDEIGLDDNGEKEISFKIIHKNFGKQIIKYRLKIKRPDGTEAFILQDGTTSASSSDSTVFPKQQGLLLEDVVYTTTIDQIGEYIIELETLYRGGGSSLHQQLTRVIGVAAKSKYKLARSMLNEVPHSLFIDHDHRVKVFTEDNVLHEFQFHKDGVMIDYSEKILYFVEDYFLVDVE